MSATALLLTCCVCGRPDCPRVETRQGRVHICKPCFVMVEPDAGYPDGEWPSEPYYDMARLRAEALSALICDVVRMQYGGARYFELHSLAQREKARENSYGEGI